MIRSLRRLLAAVLLLSAVLVQAGFPASARTVKKSQKKTASQTSSAAVQKDAGPVWDIILFWGQSNMLGCTKGTELSYEGLESDLASLSKTSGIEADILKATQSASITNITVPDNSIYQYNILTGSLDEISTGDLIGIRGQDAEGSYDGVTFDEKTQTFQECRLAEGDQPAALAAVSTNMIPAFCAKYHEITGHNVIVLFDAIGGVGIQAFLPMNHPDYKAADPTSSVQYSHMFEYISACYQGALDVCSKIGASVGSSFWVSFQGESDIGNTSYMKYYREVTDLLSGLGIEKGALVETSSTIGDSGYYQYVEQMHQWQEKLVQESADIVLGSSLDYNEYIPDKKTYEKVPELQTKWNGISYGLAFEVASWYVDSLPENRTHLNSAALSQIGRDTARNLVKFTGLASADVAESTEQ